MNQEAFDFNEPTARHTDPDTSHGAAVIAIHQSASNRRIALAELARAGAEGLTDFELAARTNIGQTSIGKRRGELRDAGLVTGLMIPCAEHPSGWKPVTRDAPSGASARVWILTDIGAEYAYNEGLTGRVAS